ncbi:putative kinesin-1 motor protein [Ceraceosorus guamensis]|uniref:Putative kinesin-1 motor protein n=1 Tax=Ceraceosorus guamensis TaxID=1522189 RepID=A0A316VWQ3_9BASI|nr:putative kinesin-1 motor protein [Ceraceosorus guamensis]PWN41882.1 putative kinesin-1 motor protein [Ceraceosorus guamensis]
MSGNVKVVSRFRPPNSLELKEGGDIVVDFDDSEGTTVKLRNGPTSGPEAAGFTFDRVFPMGTHQQDVFEYGIKETVDDVLNGYNGTIFAYGQTGSGKTFTMMGSDIDSEDLKGIIPRITEQIFTNIAISPPHLEYLVKVSYMEIYMERIRDLLAPQNDNLQIHEEKSRGVYIKGLSDYYVSDQSEVYEIMRQGGLARAVSSTNMNAESSRSHSIFLVTIQQRNTETGSQKSGNLYLVDLAGSEKVGKTGASGQTLEEAKKINKSLSALGMVINALTDGKSSHIPYRDSKLTRILQESLGGNSRTTLIINCSPCYYNQDETISTLRFGVRAKSIKNKARVNAELSPAELKALLKKAQADAARQQAYITALETEVKRWRSGAQVAESEWADLSKVVVGASAGESGTIAPASASRPPSTRPITPAIEALRESRPETPSSGSMDKDERDEFLRRENELADQVTERENALKETRAKLQEAEDELAFLREREAELSETNKTYAKDSEELKLAHDRLIYEHKETTISVDILKEQIQDLHTEIEDLRRSANEPGRSATGVGQSADPAQADRDRKKAELVGQMMEGYTAGAFTALEQQVRESLSKLDLVAGDKGNLSSEDIAKIKGLFDDSQSVARENTERAQQAEEQNKLLAQSRDELEDRFAKLEAEYDELLDKTMQNDETNATGYNDAAQEVRLKLEAQYASKREAHLGEIADLKRQLELRANEKAKLQNNHEVLRSAYDELKRALAVTSAAADGGKNLAEEAREMERVRRSMTTQLAEFDNMRKNLMRDLQNRCEKVVELELALDTTREHSNNLIRNSNVKSQAKKMAHLEHNLNNLVRVQKSLVDQNTQLKKDINASTKKLMNRQDRIAQLEQQFAEAQADLKRANERFDDQVANLKQAMSHRQAKPAGAQTGAALGFGRIAKPIRGGGPIGQPGPQPGPGAAAQGLRHPGIASAQAQSIDSSSPKARSSWFFSATK